MSSKQRFTRVLIVIAVGFAVGGTWGIVSSRLSPGNLTLFWSGIGVYSIVASIILYRYLPATWTQRDSDDVNKT
jgi:hypothetical protein